MSMNDKSDRPSDFLDFHLDDRRFTFWNILPPASPERLKAIKDAIASDSGQVGSSWTNSAGFSTATTTTARFGNSATRPGTSSR